MTFSITALGGLFSLALLPLALQVSTPPAQSLDEPAALAAPLDAIDVTGSAQDELLRDIAAALASVETAQGRFIQVDANNNETSGQFYLRRPGRVRFEYDAPTPLLIVSDGTSVAIEDKDLETQDRVPLRATPLAMILGDAPDFEDRANVLGVRKQNGLIGVILEDKTGQTEGTLIMVVDADDYSLVQWQTVDGEGAITSVELAGVETGIRLNPRLFRIEEQDAEDERD